MDPTITDAFIKAAQGLGLLVGAGAFVFGCAVIGRQGSRLLSWLDERRSPTPTRFIRDTSPKLPQSKEEISKLIHYAPTQS